MKHQPQETYDYGFLYPLLVSPFAKIFGNSLSIHRWITYVFIFLSCFLVFITLISKKLNPLFCFTAAVLLHQSLINNALISIARPEGLGIFLLLLGVIIPWKFNFTYISCILSILFGMLGFLTKPYYVVAIPIVFIYLFVFISKRKSIVYALVSFFFLLISIILISVVLNYESYYNNVIFQQWNDAGYNYLHMKDQLFYFFNVNIILLIIILLSFLTVIKKYFYRKSEKASVILFNFFRDKFLLIKSLNIFRNEPVIRTKCDLLFSFAALFGLFIFIIKMGGNKGNGGGAYLFHLVSPFLILSTFLIIKAANNKLFNIVASILLIFTLNNQFQTAEYDFAKSSECFEKIEDIIKKSDYTFNSPEVVSIMIQQNKPVYNSGHSQFFVRGISPLSLKLGASAGVAQREKDFLLENNRKIINKDFDLILLSKGSRKWPALVRNYYCKDTLCATMIYQNWEIEVWYPSE